MAAIGGVERTKNKDQASGYAGLDGSGLLQADQFPSDFQIQVRRGTLAELAAVTLAEGEPGYVTDGKALFIGDGSTAGGILVGGGTRTQAVSANGFTAQHYGCNYLQLTADVTSADGSPIEWKGSLADGKPGQRLVLVLVLSIIDQSSSGTYFRLTVTTNSNGAGIAGRTADEAFDGETPTYRSFRYVLSWHEDSGEADTGFWSVESGENSTSPNVFGLSSADVGPILPNSFGSANGMYGDYTTAFGSGNQVDGDYATAFGYGARAYMDGSVASAITNLSSGSGIQQTCIVTLVRITSNAVATDLTTDAGNPSASNTIKIGYGTNNKKAVTFTILVSGYCSAGTYAGETVGYIITGLIANVSGTTAIVGTPTVTAYESANLTGCNASVAANDSTDCLRVLVTGIASHTIKWCATCILCESGHT